MKERIAIFGETFFVYDDTILSLPNKTFTPGAYSTIGILAVHAFVSVIFSCFI